MNERPAQDSAPICITGMHRSGTSSLAQLLYWCEVYLGPREELFAAGPANPDGYWENRKFVSINNKIFESYRGGWDLPPSLDGDWHESEQMEPLKEEARRLVREFEGHGVWGWKDPRNSLTMPFWLDVLPRTKVVLSIRNPLEVAFSLRKRGNSSLAFGLDLWRVYNQRLLDTMPEDRYVVTHYEKYFYRPEDELRRVLEFLGVPFSGQLIAHARSNTLKGLRHHSVTRAELLEAAESFPDVVALYDQLCQQAEFDPENPVATTKEIA